MRISVIIPTKDRENVLERAIRSVEAQTVPVDEILVFDDGSRDGTVDLVTGLARSNPAIRLLRSETSRGAPTARNTCAEASTGDLLGLLDSDDVWKPAKLERQIALLDRHPEAPAAFSGFEFHYQTRGLRVSRTPPVVTRADLCIRNALGGSSSALVRREAWISTGGFSADMPACQDWDFWLRLAELGPLVADPDPLVEYHFDGDGRISRNRSRVEDGHSRLFAAIERIIPQRDRRRVRAFHAIRMAEIYAEQCFDPAMNLRKAVTAAVVGRTPETATLALRAVGKMLVGSLSRIGAPG